MLLHLLHCALFQLSRSNVLVLHLLSELLASSKTYLVYVGHVDIGVLEHIAFYNNMWQFIVVYRTYCFVEQIALYNISLLNRRIEQFDNKLSHKINITL